MELTVVAEKPHELTLSRVYGCLLTRIKATTSPRGRLTFPFLPKKDRDDLRYGLEEDVDFVAYLSYEQRGHRRSTVAEWSNGKFVPIIAKSRNTKPWIVRRDHLQAYGVLWQWRLGV
jgi:pyruvate kinase